MNYRFAMPADTPILARMNQQLIQDERNRRPASLDELGRSMAAFLADGHAAILFENNDEPAGYALYKREEDCIFIRHFFVTPDLRRKGAGRRAFHWLQTNAWQDRPRVRLDVLVVNAAGIAFWRSLGFTDYSLTMELEQPPTKH
jgi:GNAT superfamily N-acetyltransferase